MSSNYANHGEDKSFLENGEKAENKRQSNGKYQQSYNEQLTDNVTCGFWIFKGPFFQRFANQRTYVFLYGIIGCVFAMTYAYFNGTITTIEKRFKIPSKNTGILSIGNNISQMLVSAIISYYGGKGHRPRWMAYGLLTIVTFCLMTAAPHFMYGPGEDALALTEEYAAMFDSNSSLEVVESHRRKLLCKVDGNDSECEVGEGNLAPQVVFFVAQLISGIGGSMYYTLGTAYLDDNTKKSQTPTMFSLSFFLHMLGPPIGYALSSLCLRVYIAPDLHPFINEKDPRWLGSWWMGWIIFAILLLIFAFLLGMFPKELPKSVEANMQIENEKLKTNDEDSRNVDEKSSVKDMLKTFKSLLKNKTLMYNNVSSVFYLFGYMPYWIFTPKYIEIEYRQSAAASSMVTGTVALVFSAIGILLSGWVISKLKPSARYLAGWNVIVGFLTVVGILIYTVIGCPENEQSFSLNFNVNSLNNTPTCNSACHCEYVRYSPVCGADNITYISPCHAGCKQQIDDATGKKIYFDCACITKVSNITNNLMLGSSSANFNQVQNLSSTISNSYSPSFLSDSFPGGQALAGACPVDCFKQFIIFLVVMCFLKFIGAAGRASNFLVGIRCVPEKDKTVAMGFGMMMVCLFTFIPSPIFFGWILDRLCLVWGKTCTNNGNCWLYDPVSLRIVLNSVAAVFILIGTLFDCGVWYYVKNLKIFDEEEKTVEMQELRRKDEKETN